MSNPTYKVTIRVFVKEMLAFYKDNSQYGTTPDKAYPADMFYELYAPSSPFYGSLRNIMVFQNNCNYQWLIESTDGTPLTFSSSADDAIMEMEMITETPATKEKWKEMFVFAGEPDVDADGKLKVKDNKTDENSFALETSSDVSKGGKVKYSILFEFKVGKDTKYGKVDPGTDVLMPPPEWPD